MSRHPRGTARVWARVWGNESVYEPHPSLYSALTVKYAFLALYGGVAAAFGITTVEVTVGRGWSIALPLIIMISSIGCIIGVRVTRRYRNRIGTPDALPERVVLVEIVSTFILILFLFGYSVSIVVRTFGDGDWERLAYAVLPTAVTIVPLYRMLHLAEREETPEPMGGTKGE